MTPDASIEQPEQRLLRPEATSPATMHESIRMKRGRILFILGGGGSRARYWYSSRQLWSANEVGGGVSKKSTLL